LRRYPSLTDLLDLPSKRSDRRVEYPVSA
jgi:hypothetical protein